MEFTFNNVHLSEQIAVKCGVTTFVGIGFGLLAYKKLTKNMKVSDSLIRFWCIKSAHNLLRGGYLGLFTCYYSICQYKSNTIGTY